LEFLVFREEKQIKEKRKNKNEKTIYTGTAPNKQKKNKEIFLGFLFILLIKLKRKSQKEARNIFGFSRSFSNTQKESKKINLTWIIQWKRMNTDN
jgi:hypothetical protein